ncbi:MULTISPECIES: hypothetical protein [Bacteria]|uniref:hypothetical protein n=1 Tax=Bacteria TaxID=2 RepID=UPI003C7DB5CE
MPTRKEAIIMALHGLSVRFRKPAPIVLALAALVAALTGSFLLAAAGDAFTLGRVLLTAVVPILAFAAVALAVVPRLTTVGRSFAFLVGGVLALALNAAAVDAWARSIDGARPFLPSWLWFVLACVVAGLSAVVVWPRSVLIAFPLAAVGSASLFLIIAIPFASIGLAALALSVALLAAKRPLARTAVTAE